MPCNDSKFSKSDTIELLFSFLEIQLLIDEKLLLTKHFWCLVYSVQSIVGGARPDEGMGCGKDSESHGWTAAPQVWERSIEVILVTPKTRHKEKQLPHFLPAGADQIE